MLKEVISAGDATIYAERWTNSCLCRSSNAWDRRYWRMLCEECQEKQKSGTDDKPSQDKEHNMLAMRYNKNKIDKNRKIGI